MSAIRTTNNIKGGNIAFYFASPALAAFLTFITYELALGSLTATKVFTVLGVLQSVRLHLGYFFPVGVQVCELWLCLAFRIFVSSLLPTESCRIDGRCASFRRFASIRRASSLGSQ